MKNNQLENLDLKIVIRKIKKYQMDSSQNGKDTRISKSED